MAKFKKECLYYNFESAEVLEDRVYPELLKAIDSSSFITEDDLGYTYCYYDPDLITELNTVTHKELAQWLASGRGQVLTKEQVKMAMEYVIDMENEPVPEDVKVRAWDDDEWNIPTKEYLEER